MALLTSKVIHLILDLNKVNHLDFNQNEDFWELFKMVAPSVSWSAVSWHRSSANQRW